MQLEDTMPRPEFGRNSELCDKCSQPVPIENSVLFFEWCLGNLEVMFARQDRHLLPVQGHVPCEGSPSRAQYLEGQPRDPRGAYGYYANAEANFREAYAEIMAAIGK